MMADRGISVTHTTILRWVQRYLPEFEKRWQRPARAVGGSWRMDETYIKVCGQWVYLYRAVDKAGRTVDFFLRRNRDVNAAKNFSVGRCRILAHLRRSRWTPMQPRIEREVLRPSFRR